MKKFLLFGIIFVLSSSLFAKTARITVDNSVAEPLFFKARVAEVKDFQVEEKILPGEKKTIELNDIVFWHQIQISTEKEVIIREYTDCLRAFYYFVRGRNNKIALLYNCTG